MNKIKYDMINYFRKNNLSLNKMLACVFNKKILKIKYLNCCRLKSMPEYKFYLLKFNVVLEDYSNYIVLIKLANKNKIQENMFCYWLFCEEYYKINSNFYSSKANIMNIEVKEYEKRYQLQLLKENRKIWKNSYVDIINLYKYKRKNLNQNSYNDNIILFVAVI